MNTVTAECVVCHRKEEVVTNTPNLYESIIVKENYVCSKCTAETVRVKINVTCSKCKGKFCTRVLAKYKDRYDKDWVCPACSPSNGHSKKEVKKPVTEHCAYCYADKGVCSHSELSCGLAKDFVMFDTCSLYSNKNDKTCSIMSVSGIQKNRIDIHCFRYFPLHSAKYLLSKKNVVIMRFRIGSKKNYKTRVTVYSFRKDKFSPLFDHEYEKSSNWIVEVRDFLTAKVPRLVNAEEHE